MQIHEAWLIHERPQSQSFLIRETKLVDHLPSMSAFSQRVLEQLFPTHHSSIAFLEDLNNGSKKCKISHRNFYRKTQKQKKRGGATRNFTGSLATRREIRLETSKAWRDPAQTIFMSSTSNSALFLSSER